MHIPSPYIASLVLRSLSAPQSAGYLPGDEEGAHVFGEEEESEELQRERRNALREAVKVLSFDSEADASLGRGGVGVYLEILGLVQNLEGLTMRPMLTKSATYVSTFLSFLPLFFLN
jgi:hypothetical protein